MMIIDAVTAEEVALNTASERLITAAKALAKEAASCSSFKAWSAACDKLEDAAVRFAAAKAAFEAGKEAM